MHHFEVAMSLCDELGDRLLTRDLRPGDFVHLQGDDAGTVSVVASGQLVVEAYPCGGDVPVPIGILGPGCLVGEDGLGGPARRCSTVRTLTRSRLLVAFRDELSDAISRRPEVRRHFATLLASLQQVRVREQLASCGPRVDVRLARWMLHCAEVFDPVGSGRPISLRQETLAQLAGTRRPTANRMMRDFEAAGLLRLMRGGFVVPDSTSLLGWIADRCGDA